MALPFETVLKQISVHCTRAQLYQVLEEVTATLKAQDVSLGTTEDKVVTKTSKSRGRPKKTADVVVVDSSVAEVTAPVEKKKNSWQQEVESVLEELRATNPSANRKEAMKEASRRRKEGTADDETLTMTTSSSLCDKILTPEEERFQFLLQNSNSKSTLTSLTNSLKYRFALPVEEAKSVATYFLAHQDEIRANLG